MAAESADNIKKPSTQSRPSTRAKSSGGPPGSSHSSLHVPDRLYSLKSVSSHHIACQFIQRPPKQPTSLIHGYMVCGLSRDPSDWLIYGQPSTGKVQRTPGSIGSFIQPSILGSIPAHDRDPATAQMFADASKAAFPNDAEILVGQQAPDSTFHTFVLQSQSSQSLYGVALRLWFKLDEERRAKVLEVVSANDQRLNGDTTWIPYCLAYLSYYPLYDLMSDYIRCAWMLYGKTPDKFNSDGGLRLTKLPPPQPDQFLRIDLDKYTFCYKIPTDPNQFQNFSLWPMFTCLTASHIIAILEAALSTKGRIIFSSQYPVILTIVAETVRHYVKTWAGLYVPVAYGRQIQEFVDEPAPYILGVTKQSRSLFTAPREALMVDLDFNRVLTSRPPGSLSNRQRKTYATRLTQALGPVTVDGVPPHLRLAYGHNARFSAIGTMMADNASPRAVKDPEWWDPVKVSFVLEHICKRIRQNYKLLAALNTVKQSSTKVSTRELAEVIHDRNSLSRNVDYAWQSYIRVKRRSEAKIIELSKREKTLEASISRRNQEYKELGDCTEQLIEETRQLQTKVNHQMRENLRVTNQLRDKTVHAKQISNHVTELLSELKDANKTMADQSELLEEMERSRKDNLATCSELETRCHMVSQERDEAHRAVIHLNSLISGLERVMTSLIAQPSRPASKQELRNARRRSFQSLPSSPAAPSPPPAQFPLHRCASANDVLPESKRHTTDFSVAMESPRGATQSEIRRSGLWQSTLPDDESSFKEKVGAVATTVQKINAQCRAAVQELADKRTEIQARNQASDQPGPAHGLKSPSLKEQSAEETSKSKAQLAVSNAISRLIQSSRNGRSDGDTSSMVSSQFSEITQRTGALSVLSSVPSLDSRAPTAMSDGISEVEEDIDNGKSNVKIQAITEEDEGEADEFVDAQPSPSKGEPLRTPVGIAEVTLIEAAP